MTILFASTLGKRPLHAAPSASTIRPILSSSTPTSTSVPPHKVEHSFQMHQLMQEQYREVQVLQAQYNEARAKNPTLLPRIQQAMSSLRNKHLAQIQGLKNRQYHGMTKTITKR